MEILNAHLWVSATDLVFGRDPKAEAFVERKNADGNTINRTESIDPMDTG